MVDQARTMLCRGFLLSLLMVSFSDGQNFQGIRNEAIKIKQLKSVDWKLVAERIGHLDIIDKFPNRGLFSNFQHNSAYAKNISDECRNSLEEYSSHLEKPIVYPYASEMNYSSGHLPNDPLQTLVFSWNLNSFGYYTQCRSVEVPPGLSFDSPQYCSTVAQLAPSLSIYLGKCLPGSCSNEELQKIISFYMPENGPKISVDCPHTPPFSTAAIIALVVSSLLLFLMLVATIYDYLLRYERQRREQVEIQSNGIDNKSVETYFGKKEIENGAVELKDQSPSLTLEPIQPKQTTAPHHPGNLGRALLSFSVLSNTAKLLSTNQSGNLRALNGLRVLSMFWVILGHTLSFMNPYLIANLRYMYGEVVFYFGTQIIWNGTFSVESFFVLSGFLVAYLTLWRLHKNGGSLNWFLFYFHRYWRLTPMFAFTILLYFLFPYYVGGATSIYDRTPAYPYECREYWWATLLYFGNLYPFPGTLGTCVGWTWFLAVDIQCYVISPLFLLLLYKNWKIGLPFTIFVTLCSMGVTAGFAAYFGIPDGLDAEYYNDNLPYPGAEYIHNKPWKNLPVYLVGLLTGWLVYHCEKERLELKGLLRRLGLPAGSKWLLVCLGWCCSIVLALTCLFGLWSTVVHASEGREGNALDQWQAVLYQAASPVAWAVSISWVAFACVSGYGGPINQLLSWKFWIPMGRLSYGAYLIHPITILIYYFSWDVQYYFEYYSYICLFLSQLVIAYVAAIFLSLAVEAPMIGLEKVLLGNKRK